MQPDSSLSQEPQNVPPVAELKKSPMKINFLAIILAIVLLILAGVGYWGFTLNTSLKATQGTLTTLQGKYDSLTSEKNTLASNLDTITAELEATKAELEKTKTDLSKAEQKAASLRASMDKAMDWLNVAIAVEVDGENDKSVMEKINTLGDSKLASLYKASTDFEIKSSNDIDKWLELFNDFERYLFNGIVDRLK